MLNQYLAKSALFLATATTMICAGSLSGKVVNADSSGRSGVTVALSGTALTATTDASGAWRLETSVGIGLRRQTTVTPTPHLVVDNGHLRLRFQGQDLRGRGCVAAAAGIGAPSQGVAGRVAATPPDTLVYSFGGKVFLRDTITDLTITGIVRMYDTTWNAAITYGYLTDSRDGQTYRSVKIGSQTWMAQNLNYKVDSSWWNYSGSNSSVEYGRLYKWAAVMGLDDSCNSKSCSTQVRLPRQGICPSGWHVPSDAEWMKLTDTILISSTAGAVLKSAWGWQYPGNGSDKHGFRGLPAGFRYLKNGSIYPLSFYAYFWSASENGASSAWRRFFDYGRSDVSHDYQPMMYGLSLRCIKDAL